MKKRLKWIIPTSIILIILVAFAGYTGLYYHADQTAAEAMRSDATVTVARTDQGWFFDGPSEENVLVFYPGAKVEETAYAPLLHRLAGSGMDVHLVKMPFRLAIFGADRAAQIPGLARYENHYVGGHSLGGAMAANFAAKHPEGLAGVILLAAYPVKEIDTGLLLVSIYGSEDGVLNMEKVADGRALATKSYRECVIEGGNHAGFGNYGAQKGDGKAQVSREEQQERTVEEIMDAATILNADKDQEMTNNGAEVPSKR